MIADIVDLADSTILRGLFYQIQPQTVIIKSKQDEQRMSIIRQLLGHPLPAQNDTASANWGSDSYGPTGPTGQGMQQEDNQSSFYQDYGNEDGRATCRLHCVPASFFNLDAGLKIFAFSLS